MPSSESFNKPVMFQSRLYRLEPSNVDVEFYYPKADGNLTSPLAQILGPAS